MTTTSELEAFREISALLTGIPAANLCTDDTLLAAHCHAARESDPGAFQGLLLAHNKHPRLSALVLVEEILNNSGLPVRFLARSIILTWLLGSWYPPSDLRRASLQLGGARVTASTVLSARAYTDGWVWKIAQAHPMGAVSLAGSWSGPPPPLRELESATTSNPLARPALVGAGHGALD